MAEKEDRYRDIFDVLSKSNKQLVGLDYGQFSLFMDSSDEYRKKVREALDAEGYKDTNNVFNDQIGIGMEEKTQPIPYAQKTTNTMSAAQQPQMKVSNGVAPTAPTAPKLDRNSVSPRVRDMFDKSIFVPQYQEAMEKDKANKKKFDAEFEEAKKKGEAQQAEIDRQYQVEVEKQIKKQVVANYKNQGIDLTDEQVNQYIKKLRSSGELNKIIKQNEEESKKEIREQLKANGISEDKLDFWTNYEYRRNLSHYIRMGNDKTYADSYNKMEAERKAEEDRKAEEEQKRQDAIAKAYPNGTGIEITPTTPIEDIPLPDMGKSLFQTDLDKQNGSYHSIEDFVEMMKQKYPQKEKELEAWLNGKRSDNDYMLTAKMARQYKSTTDYSRGWYDYQQRIKNYTFFDNQYCEYLNTILNANTNNPIIRRRELFPNAPTRKNIEQAKSKEAMEHRKEMNAKGISFAEEYKGTNSDLWSGFCGKFRGTYDDGQLNYFFNHKLGDYAILMNGRYISMLGLEEKGGSVNSKFFSVFRNIWKDYHDYIREELKYERQYEYAVKNEFSTAVSAGVTRSTANIVKAIASIGDADLRTDVGGRMAGEIQRETSALYRWADDITQDCEIQNQMLFDQYGYNRDGSAKDFMDLWSGGHKLQAFDYLLNASLGSMHTTAMAAIPYVGAALVFADSYQSQLDMLDEMYPDLSEDKKQISALGAGVNEMLWERISIGELKGLYRGAFRSGGMSGRFISDSLNLFADNYATKILRRAGVSNAKVLNGVKIGTMGLGTMAWQGFVEMTEEGMTTIGNQAIDQAIGIRNGFDFKEVVNDALIGAFSGFTHSSIAAGKQTSNQIEFNRKVEQTAAYNNTREVVRITRSFDDWCNKNKLTPEQIKTLEVMIEHYVNSGYYTRDNIAEYVASLGIDASQNLTDEQIMGAMYNINMEEIGQSIFLNNERGVRQALAMVDGYYGHGGVLVAERFMNEKHLTEEQVSRLLFGNNLSETETTQRDELISALEETEKNRTEFDEFQDEFCKQVGITRNELDQMQLNQSYGRTLNSEVEQKKQDEILSQYREAVKEKNLNTSMYNGIASRVANMRDVINTATNSTNGNIQLVREKGNSKSPIIRVVAGTLNAKFDSNGKLVIDKATSQQTVVALDEMGIKKTIPIENLEILLSRNANAVIATQAVNIQHEEINKRMYKLGDVVVDNLGNTYRIDDIGATLLVTPFENGQFGEQREIGGDQLTNLQKLNFSEGENLGLFKVDSSNEDGSINVVFQDGTQGTFNNTYEALEFASAQNFDVQGYVNDSLSIEEQSAQEGGAVDANNQNQTTQSNDTTTEEESKEEEKPRELTEREKIERDVNEALEAEKNGDTTLVEDAIAEAKAEYDRILEEQKKNPLPSALTHRKERQAEIARRNKELSIIAQEVQHWENVKKEVEYAKNPSLRQEERNQQFDKIRKNISDFVTQFNTKREQVVIINDISEIPESEKDARTALERGVNVTAWAHGKAYIYLPAVVGTAVRNGMTIEDVVKMKTFHELVTHLNLKKAIGEEKYNKFLDDVWSIMSARQRAYYIRYVWNNNKQLGGKRKFDRLSEEEQRKFVEDVNNIREAADEFIANVSEGMAQDILSEEEKTFFGKVMDKFKDLLRSLGITKFGEEDVRKALLESFRYSISDAVEENKAENKDGESGSRMSAEEIRINDKFNDELQQLIKGELDESHIFDFGMPSKKLLYAGIENIGLQMKAKTLLKKASEDNEHLHPFELSDVENLPYALNHPIAIFNSEEGDYRKVIMTELKTREGNNFLGIIQVKNTSGRNFAEINSVISLYGKDSTIRIAKWFDSTNRNGLRLDEELCKWADTKKASDWLTNNASLVHSVGLSVKRIAKVIKKFENAQFLEDEISPLERNSSNNGNNRTNFSVEDDADTRFSTSEDLFDRFGDRWLNEQTNESDGRHSTQVKNTLKSYEKFASWVEQDSKGRDVKILDASSGLGLGTQHIRSLGMQIDDVEPYASADRETPTYDSYYKIDQKYDYIISNAVLNVIPDDWRANVLHNMANLLNDGGKMLINVRGAKEVEKQGIEGKTRISLDSKSEILVQRPNGTIRAYQKGFTKEELKGFVESELGNGYNVEIANTNNAGGSYDTAVVVTKKGDTHFSVEESKESIARATERLQSEGVNADAETSSVRFSINYELTDKKKSQIAKDIMAMTGCSKQEVDRYIQSIESLANIIRDNTNYQFEADEAESPIKKNSDYGKSIDFTNICKKRRALTAAVDVLINRHPNMLLSYDVLTEIRQILSDKKFIVNCGLCYVEGRRQNAESVMDTFISGLVHGTDLSQNKKVAAKARKMIDKNDTYIPTKYDLYSAQGRLNLRKNHPSIFEAFNYINNLRGMQAVNFNQNDAEYMGQIRKFRKDTVANYNMHGGLRMFSYSDFEFHHMLDVMQVIRDASSKGLTMQAYTKVAEFAWLVADTGVKVNRSLIAKGKGYEVVDGKEVLVYDPVEGIDVNSEAFKRVDSSNPNVGNILVGISDKHIRLAMKDPFVHYIIPYHSSQISLKVRKKLGVDKWTDYQNSQSERIKGKGTKAEKGINIYDIINNHPEIKNEREFVELFLKECDEKGLIPRFDQFLDKDADGNYVYTEGYYKLLLDYKLFDEQGNILRQDVVKPNFDQEAIDTIIANYNEDIEQGNDWRQEVPSDVIDEIEEKLKEKFGEDMVNTKFSVEDDADTRFSIIGELGATALDRAEEATTRIDNLNVARQMEEQGKDEQSIWLATGWQRGKDKKWRYEVVDTEKIKSNVEKYFENNDNSQLSKTTLEVLYGDDNILFYAYPQLRDIEVTLDPKWRKDNGGFYRHADNSINIVTINGNVGITTKGLEHEVQHAIQRIEGFSSGFNSKIAMDTEEFKSKTKDIVKDEMDAIEKLEKEEKGLRDEIESLKVESPYSYYTKDFEKYAGEFNQNETVKKIRGNLRKIYEIPYDKRTEDDWRRMKTLRHNLDFVFSILAKEKGVLQPNYEQIYDLVQRAGDLCNELDKLDKKVKEKTKDIAYDIYMRNTGETEARNVEKRLGMTPAQRRQTLLSETEDVAREDQHLLDLVLKENSNITSNNDTRFSAEEDTRFDIDDDADGIKFSIVSNPAQFNQAPKFQETGFEHESILQYLKRHGEWQRQKAIYQGLTGDDIAEVPSWDSVKAELAEAHITLGDYMKAYTKWRAQKEQAEREADFRRAVSDFEKEVQKMNNFWTRQTEKFVDKYNRVDRMIERMKRHGIKVDSSNNAYQDFMKQSARAQHMIGQFEENEMKNLYDVYSKIVNGSFLKDLNHKWDERGNIAEHNVKNAINRKRRRANQRLAKNAQYEWIVDGKPSGRYLTAMDMIGVYMQIMDSRESADMGLVSRGALNVGSQIRATANNNANATKLEDAIIAQVEKAIMDSGVKVEDFWDAIRAVNDFSAKYQLENGLITQETYDKWKDRKYYVPERGWVEEELTGFDSGKTADPTFVATNSNPLTKQAKGRTTLAGNPLNYMQSMAHSSIIHVEKMKTKQKMLELCLANEEWGRDNGEFQVKKVYAKYVRDANGNIVYETDDSGNRLEGQPQIEYVYNSPTAEEVEHDNAIKEQMKKLSEGIKTLSQKLKEYSKKDADANDGRSITIIQHKLDAMYAQMEDLRSKLTYADYLYMSDIQKGDKRYNGNQNIMVVRKDGSDYVIEFTDRKIADCFNNRFMKPQNNEFFRSVAKLTRFMAASKTHLSPAFAARNFMRDAQFAALITAASKGINHSLEGAKHTAMGTWAVINYVANSDKYKNARQGESKYFKYIREYAQAGAATGYSFSKPVEQNLRDMMDEFYRKTKIDGMTENEVARAFLNFISSGSEIMKGLEDTIGFFSEVSETVTRFGEYVTEREHGATIEDAATEAKELTVNFNRSGELAGVMGGLWTFFNATIQANAKLYYTFRKNPKGAMKFVGELSCFAGLSFLMTLLNPDEPEDEVMWSDYDKWTKYTFKHLRIEAPHQFRIPMMWGYEMAQVFNGRKSAEEALTNIMSFTLGDLLPAPFNIGDAISFDKKTGYSGINLGDYIGRNMPSITTPIFDIILNKDFRGQTIHKEPFMSNKKGEKAYSEMYKDGTNETLIEMCRWIRDITGGDSTQEYKGKGVDWNPSDIQHLIEAYSPGVASMASDIINMIYLAGQSEVISAQQVPFVKNFVRPYNGDKAYAYEYWNCKNRLDFLRSKYKNLPFEKQNKLYNSKEYKRYMDAETIFRMYDNKIMRPSSEWLNVSTNDIKAIRKANDLLVGVRFDL